jgi:hypothetical protein
MSAPNLKILPKVAPPKNDLVVSRLRELLKQAESGELRSLVYAAQIVHPNGEDDALSGYVYGEQSKMDSLIVAMERSKLLAMGVRFVSSE